MMTDREKKIISESFIDCARVSTVNSMEFMKSAFKGLKNMSLKYPEPLTLEQICDFMIIFFEETIKNFGDDKDKK